MNLVSFVDELVKVGGLTCLYKRADDAEVNTVDIPHGMMSHETMPERIIVNPAEVATRLPNLARSGTAIPSGTLGGVTQSKWPIDREKFNRLYRRSQ